MDSLRSLYFDPASPATRRAAPVWLWLLIGFVFLPFTIIQTMIPLAAWLAPICLLRFSRTARSGGVALAYIALAQIVAGVIAVRGGEGGSLVLAAIGFAFLVFHALISTLPYAADRWIAPRSGAANRTLVFPLAFTSVEWLMSLLRVTNTTGSMVYSQYDCLALLQVVSVFGMWGLTFLIGWTAATINTLWEAGFALRARPRLVVALVVVWASVLLFGSLRMNFAPASSPTVKAATVTIDRETFDVTVKPPFDWLNFYQSNDETRAAVRPRLQAGVDQLLFRTETALRAGAKLVGWQETAARVLEEDRRRRLIAPPRWLSTMAPTSRLHSACSLGRRRGRIISTSRSSSTIRGRSCGAMTRLFPSFRRRPSSPPSGQAACPSPTRRSGLFRRRSATTFISPR